MNKTRDPLWTQDYNKMCPKYSDTFSISHLSLMPLIKLCPPSPPISLGQWLAECNRLREKKYNSKNVTRACSMKICMRIEEKHILHSMESLRTFCPIFLFPSTGFSSIRSRQLPENPYSIDRVFVIGIYIRTFVE